MPRQLTITGNELLDQPCDGCGNHAAELAIYRESDPFPITLLYCRVCIGEPDDPSLEWITGEPLEIDLTPAVNRAALQLGMFEIAPASTFDGPAASPMRGDRPLF
jgi:hypothetical protein